MILRVEEQVPSFMPAQKSAAQEEKKNALGTLPAK